MRKGAKGKGGRGRGATEGRGRTRLQGGGGGGVCCEVCLYTAGEEDEIHADVVLEWVGSRFDARLWEAFLSGAGLLACWAAGLFAVSCSAARSFLVAVFQHRTASHSIAQHTDAEGDGGGDGEAQKQNTKRGRAWQDYAHTNHPRAYSDHRIVFTRPSPTRTLTDWVVTASTALTDCGLAVEISPSPIPLGLAPALRGVCLPPTNTYRAARGTQHGGLRTAVRGRVPSSTPTVSTRQHALAGHSQAWDQAVVHAMRTLQSTLTQEIEQPLQQELQRADGRSRFVHARDQVRACTTSFCTVAPRCNGLSDQMHHRACTRVA